MGMYKKFMFSIVSLKKKTVCVSCKCLLFVQYISSPVATYLFFNLVIFFIVARVVDLDKRITVIKKMQS